MKYITTKIFLIALSFTLASCLTNRPPRPNPEQKAPIAAEFVNPHPSGTYEHFTAERRYPKTTRIYRNKSLLSQTNSSNSSIVISLSKQRAFLMNGDQVAMDYPISSGRKKYPTPTGEFRILEKLKDKRSNTYGKIYDAEEKLVKRDADLKKDKVPEGGKYVGAAMPYWMRMSWDGIGHHVGRVPRYPASHGCIRGVKSVMPTVYSKVATGTRVIVE